MKLVVLSLAFAFSSLGLAAQSAAPAGLSTYRVGPIGNGCPVSMSLQQTLSHQLQTVQNGKVIKAPATQLTLTLGVPVSSGSMFGGMQPVQGDRQPPATPARMLPRVAFATATVHGFGAGPEFELVSPAVGQNMRGNRRPAPQKSLKLQFNSQDGTSVAEMWIPGFGAVRWLDLDSITYSDGSTWKRNSSETCAVTPDPFMLVGADSTSAPAGK
ncbi:MAG TPA: hypothetical protein VGR47_23280 [Terracidiphilus sp.]|nr:hypothetical protein [Terracidiphilus sp.]